MLRTREAVVVAVIYDGDVPDTGFDWRMNFVGKRVADDHSFFVRQICLIRPCIIVSVGEIISRLGNVLLKGA